MQEDDAGVNVPDIAAVTVTDTLVVVAPKYPAGTGGV